MQRIFLKHFFLLFKEVAKQDDSEAVMKNVQTIYAGLTYGRGTLNETIDSGADANRGFEA